MVNLTGSWCNSRETGSLNIVLTSFDLVTLFENVSENKDNQVELRETINK